MRRLSLLAASAVLALSALPALAIDASEAPAIYEASDLSEEADIALWCGAAFSLAADQSKEADAEASKTFQAKADVLLARAGELMVEGGMTVEEVGPVAEAYTYHAADQIIAEKSEADYTLDQCEVEATR